MHAVSTHRPTNTHTHMHTYTSIHTIVRAQTGTQRPVFKIPRSCNLLWQTHWRWFLHPRADHHPPVERHPFRNLTKIPRYLWRSHCSTSSSIRKFSTAGTSRQTGRIVLFHRRGGLRSRGKLFVQRLDDFRMCVGEGTPWETTPFLLGHWRGWPILLRDRPTEWLRRGPAHPRNLPPAPTSRFLRRR